MSSQSRCGAKSNSDQISTDDNEDKKFVSQAVTFMIGHARNGFVSVCAGVASLLKEQARLKQEVESLQQEALISKKESTKHFNEAQVQAEVNEALISKAESTKSHNKVQVQAEVNEAVISKKESSKHSNEAQVQAEVSETLISKTELAKDYNEVQVQVEISEALISKTESAKHNEVQVHFEVNEALISGKKSSKHYNEAQVQAEVCKEREILNSDSTSTNKKSLEHIAERNSMIKLSKQLPYKKLKSCICNMCLINKDESPLTAPLEKGMKTIIRGELYGTVEYVGHVEALDFPEIQVGIAFSEAIGNTDGRIQNKVYFSVPKDHGMFIPLSHVLCVVR